LAAMKLSADWHDFRATLDKNHRRQGKRTQLSFDYAARKRRMTARACDEAANRGGLQLRAWRDYE